MKPKKSIYDSYPNLKKLEIPIYTDPVTHCKWKEIDNILDKKNIDKIKFSEYFGAQTQSIEGPYPWDIDDVLCRLFSSELKGTQLFMD